MNLRHPAMRPLLIVALALILGPFIAGCTVFAFMLAATAFEAGMPLWGAGELFIVAVGAAYVMGWPVALMAGVLVAFWSRQRGATWAVVMVATLVANIAFAALTQGYEFMTGQSGIPYEEFAVVLGASVCAAMLCRLLAYRFTRLAT